MHSPNITPHPSVSSLMSSFTSSLHVCLFSSIFICVLPSSQMDRKSYKDVHDSPDLIMEEGKPKPCGTCRNFPKLCCLLILCTLALGGLIAAIVLENRDSEAKYEASITGCH